MIKEWLHNRRLEKVVRELPFYMGRDIKPKEKYNSKQILRIFNKYKFNQSYLAYAIALLSGETEYNIIFGNERKKSYSSLRIEIALKYFNGNTHFNFNNLMNITKFNAQVYSYDGSGSNNNELNWGFLESSGDGGDGSGGHS